MCDHAKSEFPDIRLFNLIQTDIQRTLGSDLPFAACQDAAPQCGFCIADIHVSRSNWT
jgi:hypothetical protein